MNHCYKITLLSVLMIIFFSTVRAQENRELLLGPMDVFVPHWELGVEAGAGYDVGEDKFANLITPAVQVTAAYHFNEFLAARLAVSGFQSKNLYVFPEEKYKWNFVQPALDLKLDLSSLFLGWVPENTFRPYAYLGAGLNVSFNNDDAVNADKRWGVDFEKLWRDNRLNPVVRGGLGFDWWFNDKIALTGDACANMLPDHYNSKYGKYDNRDWHITAMLGLRFRLGDANKHTEPVWGEPPVVNPQPAKITRDQVDLTVNVQFILNVALNARKQVIGAWAGDLEQAHEAGSQVMPTRRQVRRQSTSACRVSVPTLWPTTFPPMASAATASIRITRATVYSRSISRRRTVSASVSC